MDVQVNFWAVFAATLGSLLIGSIWYSRKVFGNRWLKLARIDTTRDRGSVLKPVGVMAVTSLVTAYVLAHLTFLANEFFGHSYLQDALTTAFVVWLGFVAARFATHDTFEGRPVLLTAINVAAEFVTLMVMGLLIGLIGV